MMQDATDAEFLSLLGYEWHSSRFGDHCLIFPGDEENLYLPDRVEDLLEFAEEKKALAIPHHVAYKEGWRGANWRHFRPAVSPVVEIFSEQGCTLSDRSPYPMVLHSNGGRVTSQTIRFQLERGLRFGFVASTDDHFGYPGAYGEGVVGVWAEELSAASIFEALRARRTIAATGDRISIQFLTNGNPIGSEISFSDERIFDVSVSAPDTVESVELVRGAKTIRRHFPEDDIEGPGRLPGRSRLRIQYGWGPWSALDLERVCEWELEIRLNGGRFLSLDRCFQSGPFGEEIRDRARLVNDSTVRVHSFTSRRQAYLQDATKAIVLALDAGPDAVLALDVVRPAQLQRRIPVADLVEDNHVSFTGVFTSESIRLHRLVFPAETSCRVRWEENRRGHAGGDFYYVRVREHNGQYAWSSPVWVG
jgi:hypothetical protein